jgi:hypothetical protein
MQECRNAENAENAGMQECRNATTEENARDPELQRFWKTREC